MFLIGDKVRVKRSGGAAFDVGDICVFERDDHSSCPLFRRLSDGLTQYSYYHNMELLTRRIVTPFKGCDEAAYWG